MAKVLVVLLLLVIYNISSSQTAASLNGDSVLVPASLKYRDPSLLKRFLLGKNYRKEWSTPVKLPIFNLKESGLSIGELGGGQQTKSLRLTDRQGREWVLRTIDKDVEKALPKLLRNTIAERVTQDMVSAAHPYAPLTIPGLAKAIDVIVPSPTFYFVPDDPEFGPYRSVFANSVCMLEQREPTPDRSETESTEKVLEKLTEENDHLIIQQAALKARLLDMLIADWDRHADQWRWGEIDSGKVEYFYAIPRDRDQAYFNSNGLLIKMARMFGLRHLVGFRDDLKKLKKLNYKSWKFDALFLNELDNKEWASTIELVQFKLTDEVIHNSVKKLPPEIYALSGAAIERKIKLRRDKMMEACLDYYRFLALYPIVNGTDEAEFFHITSNKSLLIVQVFDQKNGKKGRKIYERRFDPNETKQITLNGLGSEDQFIVAEGAKSDIKLKIKGGKGSDLYNIKGEVKNSIYDDVSEKNRIESDSRSQVKIR